VLLLLYTRRQSLQALPFPHSSLCHIGQAACHGRFWCQGSTLPALALLPRDRYH